MHKEPMSLASVKSACMNDAITHSQKPWLPASLSSHTTARALHQGFHTQRQETGCAGEVHGRSGAHWRLGRAVWLFAKALTCTCFHSS
jgi:hypothetical protein